MVIDLVIKSTQFIVDIFNKLKISDQQERERISFLLEKIAEVLEFVADKLEINEYPHQKCEEMRMYSQELVDKISGVLTKERTDELYNSLMESSEIERLYAERNNDTINEIRICAGKFRATSIIVKV